jgi:hypothetical protein
VQVLLRCRTQDPCSWVGGNGQQEEGEGWGGRWALAPNVQWRT